jgi:hypothetical protein
LLALAAVLPGLIAAAIAYFYVIGALTTYEQFQEAGLPPQTAMTVVPIEQLLGRGIGELTGTAVTLVLGWLGFIFFTPESREPPGKTDEEARTFLIRAAIVVAIAIGLFASPAEFLPLIITLAVFVGGVIQIRYWRLRYITSVIVMGIVLQGTLAVTNAWLRPEPLPNASMTLTDGAPVEAPLVASNGATWYLADEESESEEKPLRAIPAARVKRVEITQEERDEPPSLFNVIFG